MEHERKKQRKNNLKKGRKKKKIQMVQKRSTGGEDKTGKELPEGGREAKWRKKQ
jgi:U3 small nucleolar ribonucleoprotein component